MYKILRREDLSSNVVLMDVEAPMVAKKCLPGQFIILRVNEEGERIPLTLSLIHISWQQWQFDYACPSDWESRPTEVWEASENQEASPEWGVELVPPGKEEWAIRLQGSPRNQNLGVPLQESVEIYCAGEKIGRLDTGEKEGEVWKLVTLDRPGTAGSAFQIFIRGEEYWPEGEKLLAGFAA